MNAPLMKKMWLVSVNVTDHLSVSGVAHSMFWAVVGPFKLFPLVSIYTFSFLALVQTAAHKAYSGCFYQTIQAMKTFQK